MELQSSSTSNFEVFVVAHEKRRQMAEQLEASVGATRTFYDAGYFGEWKNHRRAWETAKSSTATHCVVLQDDAVPVENFEQLLNEAITRHPSDPISLYVGTHRPWKQEVIDAVTEADKLGASWLVAPTLLWGVGIVLPTKLIPEMLEYCKRSRFPYDQRIGWWTEQTERPVYYTWPSLVDHADTTSVAHGEPQQGVRVAHRAGAPKWNDVVVSIRRPGSGYMLASTRDMGNQTNRLDS